MFSTRNEFDPLEDKADRGEADRAPNNEEIVMDSVYFWDAKLRIQ